MSYFLRSALAVIVFMGIAGVASAATYSWPLALSVPVTVSYPNPPPGFKVLLSCNLAGQMPNGSYPVLGAATANVPLVVASGVASYRGTLNVSMTPNAQGSGSPPVTGNTISCGLAPSTFHTKSGGNSSDSLTLP